jgi:hypothetical protein
LHSFSAPQTIAVASAQMPAPAAGDLTPIEGRVVSVPSDEAIDEKVRVDVDDTEVLKDDALVLVTKTEAANSDESDQNSASGSEDVIIVSGSDASQHLLSLRDDGQPALTFRSIFLATILSAFQAVMNQIYYVSYSTISC